MLDDRLTSAGVALRDAPVPDPSLDGLASRRRRRTTRQLAAVTVLTAVVAVVGLGALHLLDPDEHHPVRVVDVGPGEVDVPMPRTPAQLLPPHVPEGWTLSSWSELGGGIAGNPSIEVFTDWSIDFADRPYVALLDMRDASVPTVQPTDDTVLVHGSPAKIATTDGLRHVNFQLGRHILTALGSQVDDEALRQFADGIQEDVTATGGLRATWLPSGLRSTGHHARAYPGSLGTRSFTWTGPAGARLLFTTSTDEDQISLEQLLWDEPGTGGELVNGTGYGLRRRGATTRASWVVAGGHVGASAEWTGLTDDEAFDIVGDLVERSAADLADVLDGVASDSSSLGPHRRQLSPSILVYDDVVAGQHDVATVFLASGVDDDPRDVLCYRRGAGGGCGVPSDVRPTGGKALEWNGGGPGGVWISVRDDVTRLAVRYRDQGTRVYPVVRPFSGFGGLAFVAQPEGADVEWIEARTADGTARGRIVGLPTEP